jgi:CBS domain-containing protein
MAQSVAGPIVREAPVLREDTPLAEAADQLLATGLPALPVADVHGHLRGIFGERELISALFPRYLSTLGGAGFVPKSLEAALEKRQGCRDEPVREHMNREHVEVGPNFSDLGLAETFIHHRVLIVPVTEGGRVTGIVTRRDFFAALAERLR